MCRVTNIIYLLFVNIAYKFVFLRNIKKVIQTLISKNIAK